MDIKDPLPPHFNPRTAETRSSTRSSQLSRILRCVLIAFTMYGAWSFVPLLARHVGLISLPPMELKPPAATSSVALEAHIMSKCPDAKDCLVNLILPTMQRVSDRVNFQLSFIGSVQDKDDSVECRHGPSECLGNIIELCAATLYPDPKLHLGFTTCMTRDLVHIPEKSLIKGCALEHGIDFKKINDCASKDDGSFGMDLLRQSVSRTAQANVTRSCTVRLGGKVRCIRDGGVWKDCPGGSAPKNLINDIVNATTE